MPSELALLEARLLALLVDATPDELAAHLAQAVRDTPVAARRPALLQAMAGWQAAPSPAQDAWHRECTQVVAAIVSGLGRLQCRRAAGIALHGIANLALGPQGAQLLAWTQQASALPRLLQEGTALPWLCWLSQLPLPTLRGGAWVEPLIAAFPAWLEALLQQADAAHASLHARLQLPASPLRLALLATAWALWFQQRPGDRPGTRTGQRIATLPAVLEQLDLLGTGARRLCTPVADATALAPPAAAIQPERAAASRADTTRLLAPTLPVAVAAAAVLPAIAAAHPQRRTVAVLGTLAAAALGGGLLAWSRNPSPAVATADTTPRAVAHSRPASSGSNTGLRDDAGLQDQAMLLEALWTLRDTASAAGTAILPERAFAPVEGSPFALAVRAVRQQLMWLYRQDDFLQTLYDERTPPSSLVVANGSLSGTRATSGMRVVLHGQPDAPERILWSPPTNTMLNDLQRTVREAGGCFDNAVSARLACALGFYLDQDMHEAEYAPALLDPLIQRLEHRLQQQPDGHIRATNETSTLLRLKQQVHALQAIPIRGMEPTWSSWRPDPRSHLGHNAALARSLLLQLSQHPEVIALCWHHHVDPTQLEYPAHGPVRARALPGTRMATLFEAGQPPAVLAPLDTMLRGIATLLHAPVRSDGRLRVPEMLAYYAAPLPAVPMDDAQFDECLAALDRQLAPARPGVPAGARLEVEWDDRSDSPPQQDHQRLLDRLWERFDSAPATWDDALAHQGLVPADGSPLHAAWQAGQRRLQQVFEQPGVWLAMRQANATFHSLRVGADGITARVRGSGRSVVIADGLTDPLPGLLLDQLDALYRITDRLGRFSPGTAVPLINALQFHGALPAPAQLPCPAPVACTQAQLLEAIARVHASWQRRAGPLPPWRQASNELQDLGRLLARRADAATVVHRPALGTATATTLQAALPAFARLIADPATLELLQRERLAPRWMSVDADGSLRVQDAAGTLHLFNQTQALDALPVAPWGALREVASQLGGVVRSDGRANVSDILAVHGGCGPREAGHLDGPARCVERLLGELRLGMRADLLHAADALDAADLDQVRQTTTGFLAQRAPGEQTLLEYLARPLLQQGEMAVDQLHRASHYLAAMARTPRALALQAALLRDLGWYTGSHGAPTSPTLLASLTRVAIVLDLGPPSDRDARVLLGYRLHKYPNWGRTFAQIRLDFHDYLRSMGRIPASLLDMAGTLALQDHAPELLADDVPANLVYGNTIASINFVSGVHLAERLRRGLSQQMRFSELITLSAELAGDGAIPDVVRQLTLDARRLPTLDWYVYRQLEQHAALSSPLSPSARIEAALRAFDQRVSDIEQAIGDVLAPLPYRMPLVEAEIRRVFPRFPGVLADEPWNSTEFRLCNDDNHFGRSFPFHEIVAAGVLRGGAAAWRPCRTFVPDSPLNQAQGNPRYEAALQTAYARMKPGLARLADINARYQKRFDAYFRKARRGYGVLIEEALYQRPEEERAALLRGDVQVFTLRTHEPELEAGQETRNDTDPYRGRFGVVYTLMLAGQPRHFQLFPLQSRILPLQLEGALPLGGALQNRKVRLRSGNVATVQVRRGTPLPVDWEAYASDRAPAPGRSSDVIVEPLLAPPPGGGTAPRSPFHALVHPVQEGFFWLDAAAFRREGWAPTSFEDHLEDAPLWLKTVDFVVPFVENVRRISSKNRNEFAMAAFGLYLEWIIVVGPVIGGVAKVLMRPGLKMTMPRFAELSRVLGRGTLDALNPAAGSVALVRVGVSVVQRTARGNLRFLWSFLDPNRPPARAAGVRWAMREGMAIAKEGSSLASPLYEIKVRTVDGIPGAMVSPPPVASGSRTLHLVDPATLTLYGPALQERLGEGGGAAGMLIKVGGSPRTPHVSPGKALKPIKQGPKASDEDDGDELAPLQPPVVLLPDQGPLGVPAARP